MFTKVSRSAVRNYVATKYKMLANEAMGVPGAEKEEHEIPKFYTLNNTGNIMIASTVKDETSISQEVKEVFQKTIVFFGAWTKALYEKQKTLYDYDAINQIIAGSGFFVRVHQEDRSFDYSSKEIALNTAIIGSVLAGFASMGGTAALTIAQMVVSSMGSELTASIKSQQMDKKVAHLLFVCENLMGMPIITVMLFSTTAKESETVTKSNCHKTVSTTVHLTLHQDTYLFVDPQYLAKFTQNFEGNPEYDALIKKLASYIK